MNSEQAYIGCLVSYRRYTAELLAAVDPRDMQSAGAQAAKRPGTRRKPGRRRVSPPEPGHSLARASMECKGSPLQTSAAFAVGKIKKAAHMGGDRF